MKIHEITVLDFFRSLPHTYLLLFSELKLENKNLKCIIFLPFPRFWFLIHVTFSNLNFSLGSGPGAVVPPFHWCGVDSTRRFQRSEVSGVSGWFRTTTTMSSLDSELQEQLAEAGDKLLHPPESVEQLLSLLDVSILNFCFRGPANMAYPIVYGVCCVLVC